LKPGYGQASLGYGQASLGYGQAIEKVTDKSDKLPLIKSGPA